jgi:hypothetical protein
VAIGTVSELVVEARVLLQDVITPYRYSDANLLAGLNAGMLEARRLRPDMFLITPSAVASYSTVDSTAVDIDQQYRMSLLYYIVGHTHLQDNETAEDNRASAFLNKFVSQLLSVPS